MRYVRLQLQAESAEKPMILQKQAEPTSAPAPAMLEGENSSEEAGPQDGSACEAEDRDGLGYAAAMKLMLKASRLTPLHRCLSETFPFRAG